MTEPHDVPERPAGLTITRDVADDVAVLRVRGEIDADTVLPLADALATVTGAPAGRPYAVLDLGAVTFMDSTGINVLLTAHQTVREAGGWLRLACCDGPVRRVLEMVGVDQVIACYASVERALAA
ncbi:STAS domain-containing protein [Streptomyces sp. NPDC088785]|uniref:STAS domain-containing protein n=1 Tax=Streptomyces sp. NPDC088785 TaxID=3365897 RepID=UPI00380AA7DE